MNKNNETVKNLGGKTSLHESKIVAAEVASLKKFRDFVRDIIPVDSAEKAEKYRTATFLHYQELRDAQKIKIF